MRAAVGLIVCATACGRIGFDPSGSSMPGTDGATDAATTMLDGGAGVIPCADMNLGSAMGQRIAMGSTQAAGNDTSACSGDGDDVTIGWFAPVAATYRIDLCESNFGFDTVLYVRDGGCTGPQLACDDDSCGLVGIQAEVSVSLAAGQGIVIVVDGKTPVVGGNFQLAITQL
ncbi:MAG TPA: hypothetical protein VIV11_10150 [Kofleriaceae bacterium]